MDSGRWDEVGPGVFYRRYEPVDVSVGLILGPYGATVIDTRNNPAEARAIIAHAHRRFAVPVVAAITTHAHYDHSFGNEAFTGAGLPVYGHRLIPAHFAAHEAPHLRRVQADPASEPDKDWAGVTLTAPTVLVGRPRTITPGGRTVELLPLGHGHTDTDLAIHVPDAGVWFLGDVVEESGPPMFGSGSNPLGWPRVLQGLLARIGPQEAVVPGHGKVVDRDFVQAQARELGELAHVIEQSYARGLAETAVRFGPAVTVRWPADFLADALADGYALLRRGTGSA